MSESASGGAHRPSTTSASASHPTGTAGHSPASSYAPQSEVHLLDRLVVLYRYRWLCLTVFVLVSGAMIIQGYTTVRMYRAQARLQIDDERSTAIPGLQSDQNTFYEDPEPYYQTQYRILRGRDLTRRVVQRLRLDTVPEFNGTAERAPTPISMLRDFERRLVSLVRRAPAQPQEEPPKLDETTDESALVGAFIGRVGVEPVRGSRLVDVTLLSVEPKFAAEAANALAEEYVEQNLQVKLQTAQNMLDWLGKELATQQQKVEESERSLAEYREKENALSLDDKQNIVLARLNQLNDLVTKAKTQRIQREALYNQVKSIAGGAAPDSIPIIAQNPNVQALKNKLSSLQQDKVRLLERYGDKHPQVIAVNASLQDTQRQLDQETARAVQSVRNEFETSVLEERTLSQNLEAAKVEASDLNRKGIGYGVMEREAQSNRQVYEALLQREKELRVASNSRANNVRLVDRAEVPGSPVTPGGRRTWLLSIVVGLVLAVGVAMGLDYMNDTIKTPEDVTKRLRLPFLGLVPSVRGAKQQPLLTSSHAPVGEGAR